MKNALASCFGFANIFTPTPVNWLRLADGEDYMKSGAFRLYWFMKILIALTGTLVLILDAPELTLRTV